LTPQFNVVYYELLQIQLATVCFRVDKRWKKGSWEGIETELSLKYVLAGPHRVILYLKDSLGLAPALISHGQRDRAIYA